MTWGAFNGRKLKGGAYGGRKLTKAAFNGRKMSIGGESTTLLAPGRQQFSLNEGISFDQITNPLSDEKNGEIYWFGALPLDRTLKKNNSDRFLRGLRIINEIRGTTGKRTGIDVNYIIGSDSTSRIDFGFNNSTYADMSNAFSTGGDGELSVTVNRLGGKNKNTEFGSGASIVRVRRGLYGVELNRSNKLNTLFDTFTRSGQSSMTLILDDGRDRS